MSLCSTTQPLYIRFPIILGSYFSKVTIGYNPRSTARRSGGCGSPTRPSASPSCRSRTRCRRRLWHSAPPLMATPLAQRTASYGDAFSTAHRRYGATKDGTGLGCSARGRRATSSRRGRRAPSSWRPATSSTCRAGSRTWRRRGRPSPGRHAPRLFLRA